MSLTKELLDIMRNNCAKTAVKLVKEVCFAYERKRILEEIDKIDKKWNGYAEACLMQDIKKLLEAT